MHGRAALPNGCNSRACRNPALAVSSSRRQQVRAKRRASVASLRPSPQPPLAMAPSVGYNHRSSAALRTHHDPVVNGSYMPESQLSNPRKRQRTGQHLLSPPPSKRQKKLPQHTAGGGYIDTPAFWDSLSKIWLTKHALREFDRRNSRPHSPSRQARRLTTRNFLAAQKSTRQRISAADFLSNGAPTRLKEIKIFARRGGPDLSDLIGYPPSTPPDRKMSSSRSASYRNRGLSSTAKTKSTGRTTPASTTTGKTTSGLTKKSGTSNPGDANYQQRLIDGGTYPYGYKYPDGHRPPLSPNWGAANQRLAQYRASLSPSTFSEEKYQEFVEADADAFNEDEIKDSVLPAMLNAMGASSGARKNVLFTSIEPITDGITQAKPHYYYGARPEQIHKKIRDPDVPDNLISHIIPSNNDHLPAAPNFFMKAKGPAGSAAEARRQACHDGAIGARAMQSLLSYGQSEPVYDNNAYTISSTYHDGTLKMYGRSVAQPNGPGTRPEYYMHQIDTYGMTGNKKSFLQGATAFKNAQDMTRGHRNAAIARANEMAAQTVEEEEEDDDDSEAESSNLVHSFDCGTN
ncbi:hypothetical protein BDY21DRAFT_343813 [Lineolata rhizophorae]|uniref:Uncharacterized protein n=1 Tax=Lineolata rhizophorae TaxID=578093 RepID=A0A6A6P088_9PEZI|nr:hypothetical protein BDY21DRAFT_343813 [Lineolata rhizophorae]